MNKIIISSIRNNAGKTSLIAGIISLVKNKKFAYAKPFGDRLIYRRKKSWDYDATFIVNLLGREQELENHHEKITFGFDYSKLKNMYDEAGIKKALSDIVTEIGAENDILFIESGGDLASGSSLNLDAMSVAKYIDGKLIVVVSGDSRTVLDDIMYIEKYVRIKDRNFGGLIVNKVNDMDFFEKVCEPAIKGMGMDLLGVIPFREQLTYYTVDYLAEHLMARVLTGKSNLQNIVKNIIIGALSTDDPGNNPLFTSSGLNRENQLLITGGNRTDMILAALERDTIGIMLTNDIVPPRFIISKVKERGVPLLVVAADTFKTAKTINDMEVLLTKDDSDKINLFSQMVEKHTRIKELLIH
jgi:uncharacterized protein